MGERKRSRSSRQPSSVASQLVLGRSAPAMPYLRCLLDLYRRRYQQGDREALLHALDAWLSCCQGPPTWIADGFSAGWTKWVQYEAPTLDAAFGVKWTPGRHLEKQREREKLRIPILLRAEHLRQQGMPVDIRLFELVGAEIGQSGSFVSTVYYEKASERWRKILRKIRISNNL